MMSRIAMIGFEEQEPIEYKVYWLLKLLWAHILKNEVWDKGEIPLIKVTERS